MNNSIKRIEIEKENGKFSINLIKEECSSEEEIDDSTVKKISKTLGGNKKYKNMFTSIFFGNTMFEKSIKEKQNYREVVDKNNITNNT